MKAKRFLIAGVLIIVTAYIGLGFIFVVNDELAFDAARREVTLNALKANHPIKGNILNADDWDKVCIISTEDYDPYVGAKKPSIAQFASEEGLANSSANLARSLPLFNGYDLAVIFSLDGKVTKTFRVQDLDFEIENIAYRIKASTGCYSSLYVCTNDKSVIFSNEGGSKCSSN